MDLPFSGSLCWTWAGKTRLSVLLRAALDVRGTSSSILDGFSEDGSVAMGGRSGERLAQQRAETKKWSPGDGNVPINADVGMVDFQCSRRCKNRLV